MLTSFLFFLISHAVSQTISIAYPTTDAVLIAATEFRVTVASLPATARVEYTITPGRKVYVARSYPWSIWVPINSAVADGVHQVTARAKDVAGTVLATSSTVQFLVRHTNNDITMSGLTGEVSGEVTWNVSSRATATSQLSCSIDGRLTPRVQFYLSIPSGNFDSSTNVITSPSLHLFHNGDAFTFAGSTLPTGLSNNTTVYAIVVDRLRFKVASSYAGALAGTAVDFSGAGSGDIRVDVDQTLFAQGWSTQFTTGSSIISAKIRTNRLRNGTHLAYCSEWSTFTSGSGGGASPRDDTVADVFPAASVSTGNDTLGLANHRLATGRPFVLTTSVSAPSPLIAGTTYYAIYADATNISVAASKANALAGVKIDLTTQGTGNHTATFVWGNPWWRKLTGPRAEAESTFTVNNSVGPMELRSLYQDLWMTAGGSTASLAPFLFNNDGSTTPLTATDVTYDSSNSSVATVSSSGVVTPVSLGSTVVYMSYSIAGSPTQWYYAISRVTVTDGLFHHFSRSGPPRSSYSPTDSIFPRTWHYLNAKDYGFNPVVPGRLKKAGVNMISAGLPGCVGIGWTGNYAGCISSWNSAKNDTTIGWLYFSNLHDLAVYFRGDDWAANPVNSHKILHAAGTNDQRAAANVALADIAASGRGSFISTADEITGTHLGRPGPNGRPGAAGGSAVASTDAAYGGSLVVTGCPSTPCFGTGTLTITGGWAPTRSVSGQTSMFCIYGSVTTALNRCYTVTAATSSSFSFRTIDVLNGTYNASNDPNMQFTVIPYITEASIGTAIGGGGFTQYVVSGSTVTVTYTNHGCTTGGWISIRGSSSSDLNDTFQINVANSSTFTFMLDSGKTVAAGTYTSANDSGTNIWRFLHPTVVNEDFPDFIQFMTNVSGAPAVGAPALGAVGCDTQQGWTGSVFTYSELFVGNEDFVGGGAPSKGYANGPVMEDFAYRLFRKYWEERNCFALDKPVIGQVYAAGGGWWKLGPGYYMEETRDGVSGFGPPARPETASALHMLAVSAGLAGWRGYGYLSESVVDGTKIAPADGSQANDEPTQNHIRLGEQTPALKEQWAAYALAANLVGALEKWILQPNCNSPDFGAEFRTGCKASVYGTMIIITNISDSPATETIDLTRWTLGSSITLHRLTARALTVSDQTGQSSLSMSFSPGETAVLLFHQSSATRTDSVITTSVNMGAATAAYMRHSPYEFTIESGTVLACPGGTCSATVDNALPLWADFWFYDSNGLVRKSGVVQLR